MPKQLYDIRNYPQHSGTSQPQRYKPVLMGEEVKLDERTIAGFILFAQKLSKYLIYYNTNNIPYGNWETFLYNDITYHLATKTADKSSYWEATWAELMENVEGAGGGPPTDADYKKYFTWRFDFLYSLLGKMMEAFVYGSSLPQWQTDLQALYATSHLNIISFLLDKYYDASTALLINNANIFSYKDLVLSQKKTVEEQLKKYGDPVKEFLQIDDPLIPNGDFIFGTAATIPEKVTAASEYLNDLATQLISIYNGVNALAEKYLSFSLTNFEQHQPHVGLFYAYLQLSDEHRIEINGLLLKHLDFYYKQVLLVKEKPFKADDAFVTFELAKNSNEHFLKAGTLLSAGKDTGSKDIFYKTLQDILVNKTEVAEIRSFTFIKKNIKRNNTTLPLGFFACTAANSLDGKGKTLPPGKSWDAFKVSDQTYKTDTGIGLSFYAALLHEAPGEERQFSLNIEFSKPIITDDIINNFIVNYGTITIFTEEEPIVLDTSNAEKVNGGLGFKISFTISGKTKLSKARPNASLIFGNKLESVDASSMDVFKMFQTERLVKLQLLLSNHEVKIKHVDTAAGTTDLSGAFPAFGGLPKVGSSFTVVEPLLQGKTVNELSMAVEWDAKTEREYDVKIYYPSQGKGVEETIADNAPVSNFTLITQANILYKTDSIKVELQDALGHATYANDMARAIMKENDGNNNTGGNKSLIQRNLSIQSAEKISDLSQLSGEVSMIGLNASRQLLDYGPDLPDPPYTPIIKSITLRVTLGENLLASTALSIYNQYAHGTKQIKQEKDAYLIPATPFEGELYIGCKKMLPAQSLKILIQVEEGSADPTLENPNTQWAYLLNNEWQNFDVSFIDDGTKGLIQSGVLSIVLPDTDTTANTLLPAGFFWLRAAVPFKQTNAVCKIIDVRTQAVRVQFDCHSNDAAYLGTNVPASTITNLFPKQAAIKKIVQPYPSFGGSKTEAPPQLYTRTSERLRHKNRAINLWDYEHVILEAFPEVYKVKTLNHACQLKNDTSKIIAKAGHILVLVVPKTASQSTIYKPRLSKSRLAAIYEFILPLASPFASLTVMNPLFEEVKLIIEVTFMSFVKDRLFYENMLQDDVKRFLSPWAFDDGAEPEYGGVIYKAALIDFIEELSYIDFIIRLEIIHAGNSSDDMAKASSPASVLISADSHTITGVLNTDGEQSIKTKTIAYC